MITTKWMLGNSDPDFKFVQMIRHVVFVEEQKGSKFEDDTPVDKYGIHLLCYFDGEPAGAGTLFHDGEKVLLRLICVRKEFRGKQLGDLVVRLLLYKASLTDTKEMYVRSQDYIYKLYEKFGFKRIDDEEIIIDGIPHYMMKLNMAELQFPRKCDGHHNV